MIISGLLLICIGIVLLIFGKKSKEHYKKCICSGTGRERDCQDTEVVQKEYEENRITEFSDFVHPGWSTVSPGDYTYPHSEGCAWCDSSEGSKKWEEWDFTDL